MYKFPDQGIFTTHAEMKILIEMWGKDYNEVRPHSSLKGATPREYAETAVGL